MHEDTLQKFRVAKDKVKQVDSSITSDIFIALLLDTFEEAKRVLPPLQFHTIEKNSEVHIFDRLDGEMIVVRGLNGCLFCTNCQKDDCLHVGFAMSVDEVKASIARGMLRKIKKFSQ